VSPESTSTKEAPTDAKELIQQLVDAGENNPRVIGEKAYGRATPTQRDEMASWGFEQMVVELDAERKGKLAKRRLGSERQ
jgi:hypothetical protein